MTREEIINGLKMSMELTLFDPSTGEVLEPRQLNDINRTAYEAYKGAIELLEKQPDTTTHDSIPVEIGKNDEDRISGDCISRQDAAERVCEEVMSRFGASPTTGYEVADAALNRLPSAQPFYNTTMNDVLKYIDSMPEDVWQEFAACLECRGWELQKRTAKWCGSDFA